MKKNLTALFAAISFLVALMGPAAWAAKFTNQFIEFELPPQWQCNLEGAEWVCESTNDAHRHDAIIVLAAKLKGEQDTLDQYEGYLKGAKSYSSVQGKAIQAQVKYVKKVKINDQDWIDSLHLESELPNYYTRYLATLKTDIAVLVTYSIHKDKYQQYLADFEAMVATIKVFRRDPQTPEAARTPLVASIPTSPPEVANIFSPKGGADEKPNPKSGEGASGLFWALVALLAGGLIFFVKRRGR